MLFVALSLPTPQRWHLFCPATCQTLVTSRILKNGGKFVRGQTLVSELSTPNKKKYCVFGCKVLFKLIIQGWLKEWALGCVNPDL